MISRFGFFNWAPVEFQSVIPWNFLLAGFISRLDCDGAHVRPKSDGSTMCEDRTCPGTLPRFKGGVRLWNSLLDAIWCLTKTGCKAINLWYTTAVTMVASYLPCHYASVTPPPPPPPPTPSRCSAVDFVIWVAGMGFEPEKCFVCNTTDIH